MMAMLSSFHFVRPYWLALLLPAFLLWQLQKSGTDAGRRWRALIDPELLRHLLVEGDHARRFGPNGMLLALWVLGIVAIAGLAWEREPSPFADAKPPVMIVLKITPSMEGSDLAPTRLDRARQKLSDLFALREGASTGLIAYSGSPHLVLPPTADATVVLAMAQALAPAIMPREGDDVADAVAMARQVLAEGGRGGSVLVVADTVAPDQVARLEHLPRSGQDAPVIVLAALPTEQAEGGEPLKEVAAALDAPVIATSVDTSDVAGIARRLDQASNTADVLGEGEHWKEAGYWVTPILCLLALAWFRRGWVLA